jgi:hypothetical protein
MSTSAATTASRFSSRSFDFSTTEGSFDVVQHDEEGSLPTQCYICQAKFSSGVHSVLQLCSCNVSACQQCVVNRMIMNEDLSFDWLICGFKLDSCFNTGIRLLPPQCYICQTSFSATVHTVLQLCDCSVAVCQQCSIDRIMMNEDLTLDCLICGFKVDTNTNTGILRNTSRAKELADKYLERAFRFYKLPLPPKKDATSSQYYPVLVKLTRIPELATHLSELLHGEEVSTSENAQKERRKLNASYLKIQLARAEHLRSGALADETLEGGNLTIEEKPGSLPLGPLKCLNFTRHTVTRWILLFTLIIATVFTPANGQYCARNTTHPEAPGFCDDMEKTMVDNRVEVLRLEGQEAPAGPIIIQGLTFANPWNLSIPGLNVDVQYDTGSAWNVATPEMMVQLLLPLGSSSCLWESPGK